MQDIFWPALDRLPPGFRKKLEVMLAAGHQQIVLTGTDPADKWGCCPSREVGHANRLVQAGILESHTWPAAPGGCPATVYAFSGELREAGGEPSFTFNPGFRDRVSAYLKTRRVRQLPAAILRGLLLGFLLLFLVAAGLEFLPGAREKLRTFLPTAGESGQTPGTKQLRPADLGTEQQDFLLVALLHYRPRCSFCLAMERLTRLTLERHFSPEREQERLLFRALDLDSTAYGWLEEELELFTSTLVLIPFRGGTGQEPHIITAAWDLTNREEEFVAMLRAELSALLGEEDLQ